jgi:hypothetical protein
VGEFGLDPEGSRHLIDDPFEQRGEAAPYIRIEDAQRALREPGRRDDVARSAGVDLSPHDQRGRPRIDAAREHRGQVGDNLGEREREVLGQVRTGRMTAVPLEIDREPVAGRRERPLPQPHLTYVETGVAMQGVCRVDPEHSSLGDDVVGAARDGLLGRLEEEPHRGAGGIEVVAQIAQGQRRPEKRGGVDVVAARVAYVRADRGEVEAGSLPDRQRVDVGPQGHAEARIGRAKVGDQTGARQPPHGYGRLPQSVRQDRRGPLFLVAQFGMLVEVAPDVDEFGAPGLDGIAEPGEGSSRDHRLSILRRIVR